MVERKNIKSSLPFPDYKYNPAPAKPEYHNVARKDEPFKDDRACLWETAEDGITGTVIQHPPS